MTRVTGDWIESEDTRRVMSLLLGAGKHAYFVGGCVRNALMGVPVNDVDIATNCLPEQVMKLAQTKRLKVIPTGIEHGTVTVISGGTPFEITTYRKDVETDGRRAVVAFSDNMIDDARRRDFTMNALYADMDGHVIDPLGGIGDALARRIRFIDDATARIKEDYLRSLRFFRFYARYGNPNDGLDAEALAAISANLAGLDTLSGERVGTEVKKILSTENPAPTVASMAQCGVLQRLLPGTDNTSLAILVHLESGMPADPIRRLAILGGADPSRRLRLSKVDSKQLALLRAEMASAKGPAELAYRFGAATAISVDLLRAAMFETHPTPNLHELAQTGVMAKFPISATDLMPDLQGPELGKRLNQLEQCWIDSGFQLSKAQLLA